MTTTITVQSHNYPARVQIFDSGNLTSEEVLTPEDGIRTFHSTTTREVRVTDIDRLPDG